MRRRSAEILLGPLVLALAAAPALAHETGSDGSGPTLIGALTAWVADPLPWLLAALTAIVYLAGVRRVNSAHPRSKVPAWRVAAWLIAVATILIALVSPIDTYADELLTVHMVQHILLTMIAVPLFALGAPVTLALRAASPEVRQKVLLPVLHSRVIRVLALPVLGWLAFTAVMAGMHFSPIYETALEDPLVHEGEHLVLLISAALFWWPVIAADPVPHRLRHGARLVFLLAMMPVMSALGLAIYFAHDVLYQHYAQLQRAWGPPAIVDQQVAGLVMWAASDLVMLLAIAFVVANWMRADERRAKVLDLRAAR